MLERALTSFTVCDAYRYFADQALLMTSQYMLRIDYNIVQACQKFFGFALSSVQLSKCAAKFESQVRETTADLY